MDFGDTPEEAAFRAELRRWIAGQMPFPALPDGDDDRMARLTDWQRTLYDAGWAAVSFPEDYGGRGLGPVYEAIVLDELGSAGLPSAWHYGYIARVILMYGTEEQRRRFLAPAFRGDERWCQGFSEPDAGSDLASLTTRAALVGDHYVVNGQKVWTSEAHWADWCLLLARSEPGAPDHRAMSCLLVPMDAPGLTVRPFRQITGSLEFAEVFFDDVRIPAANRVGGAGDGWRIAMSTVSFERGPADVGFLADLRRSLRSLTDAARDGAVRTDGDLAARLARSYVDVEVLRAHILRTLSRRAKGQGSEVEVSVDKLLMVRTEQELTHTAMDVLGAGPLLGDRPDELHQYLWSRAASVYGGSQEIQRTIVATRLLGLPRG
ncbi:MAG TPA: acyl-CoA dehydrogenase family protein [Acidimicrobiales bacterium]|nr:acyl-CoA dehydrogenase family protein [Acidimicrobiales bacterium]